MIKMILADDEPVITRGIQKLVDWRALGIEVVGEYADGKQALHGILNKRPDLALLDISMPGMNGIEILKECAAMEIRTGIIFISGFQDFEYAKAALQYGAADYLLKPVIREELLAAVEKCLAGMNQHTSLEKEYEYIKTMETDYSKLLEMEDTVYRPIYCEVICQKGDNEQTKRLLHFSFQSFLENWIEEKNLGITFLKGDYIAVVLKGKTETDCIEILQELQEVSERAIGRRNAFVMGRQVTNMRQIPESFEECLERKGYFFFCSQYPETILRTEYPVFEKSVDLVRFTKAREQLIDAVAGQDNQAFERCYEQYGRLVCRMADGKKEDACFHFCSALRLLYEKFRILELPGLDPDMKELLEAGRNCMDYQEMLDVYEDAFLVYLRAVKESMEVSEKRDILRAKEYIETHYKEELTLSVLAGEVHMNPYYFSSFFKKNVGENFKDYVNRIRISHAIPLLSSTDKKTYEIAIAVGYHDARTFSEIFQRMYKESPNAYRKRIRKEVTKVGRD
ncbi:response regulator [Lachnospiraceae bacterium OttesenSCG-928-D06]|nr:response regulator [Lachnospiraceae bacterium OttesenSCG-928-D06]